MNLQKDTKANYINIFDWKEQFKYYTLTSKTNMTAPLKLNSNRLFAHT